MIILIHTLHLAVTKISDSGLNAKWFLNMHIRYYSKINILELKVTEVITRVHIQRLLLILS